MLVGDGRKDGGKVIGSSGTKGAEQDCAALLGKDMVPLCAVSMAHGIEVKCGIDV